MSSSDCVFCRIRDREIPSAFLYEDERAYAIRDISPKAPVHCLIIPKEHIPTVSSLTGRKLFLMAHLTRIANRIAQEEGLGERGYRLIINNGPDAGMEVSHLHLHVLGGRRLGGMA